MFPEKRWLRFSVLITILPLSLINPLDASSILGPEFQVSTGATGPGENWFKPAVAYNTLHKQFLVVHHNDWSTGRGLYGWIGASLNDPNYMYFYLYDDDKDSVQPYAAYNPLNNEFLIVWMYNANGDKNTYEIWGGILPGNGDYTQLKGPFRIMQWPNRSFWTPRVVWNSFRNEYFVVWNAMDTSGGFPGNPVDIAGKRITTAGTVIEPHVSITSGNMPHQADLAYNLAMDEYLVVWRRYWTVNDWDIYGIRLNGSEGQKIDPPGEFVIDQELTDQQSPSIATNQQDRYLVVWQKVYDPTNCCDWDIAGIELNVYGQAVGGRFDISIASDADETNPKVVAQGGPIRDFLAVWEKTGSSGSSIAAKRWGDSNVPTVGFTVASTAFWAYRSPALAHGSPQVLVVYEGDPSDPTINQHIYAKLWTPWALYLPQVRK